MLKTIFQVLAIIGRIIIFILAFTLPKNPYEIIPSISAMSFDKPLWLCIVIVGLSVYLYILYTVYDNLSKRKIA